MTKIIYKKMDKKTNQNKNTASTGKDYGFKTIAVWADLKYDIVNEAKRRSIRVYELMHEVWSFWKANK